MSFSCKYLRLFYFICLSTVASYSVSAQPATFTQSADTICYGGVVTFINTSSGTIDSVSWVSDKGILYYNASPSDTVTSRLSPGLDTVHLYVFRGTVVDSATALVFVRPELHDIATLVDSGGVIYIRGIPEGYAIWYADGHIIPGETEYDFDPGGYGPACFYAVVSNSAGCLGTTDTTCVFPAGINNVNANTPATAIFPNPTYNYLTITSTNIITQFTITNLLGQTIANQQPNTESIQIDVSNLAPGVYFVRMNNTEVRKFVKE